MPFKIKTHHTYKIEEINWTRDFQSPESADSSNGKDSTSKIRYQCTSISHLPAPPRLPSLIQVLPGRSPPKSRALVLLTLPGPSPSLRCFATVETRHLTVQFKYFPCWTLRNLCTLHWSLQTRSKIQTRFALTPRYPRKSTAPSFFCRRPQHWMWRVFTQACRLHF